MQNKYKIIIAKEVVTFISCIAVIMLIVFFYYVRNNYYIYEKDKKTTEIKNSIDSLNFYKNSFRDTFAEKKKLQNDFFKEIYNKFKIKHPEFLRNECLYYVSIDYCDAYQRERDEFWRKLFAGDLLLANNQEFLFSNYFNNTAFSSHNKIYNSTDLYNYALSTNINSKDVSTRNIHSQLTDQIKTKKYNINELNYSISSKLFSDEDLQDIFIKNLLKIYLYLTIIRVAFWSFKTVRANLYS